MSAPSDGARADARKRLAESRPTTDVALAMFHRKYGREPVPESFDQSRLADCREAVTLIWPEIAGVIADAKAEVREQIAMEIEAKAAGSHAAFAADEDEHLTHMAERFGGEWEPTDANRHDGGCGMCGLASAARIARGDS